MLRVLVLGPLLLKLDERPLEPPANARARALLGWLALHPGLHGRGELAARLRPDVLDESARQSLRQALWALRAAIGANRLVATRDRVGLAESVWVDAREFERLAATRSHAAALELVRGDLLAGLDDDWVLAERDALGDRVGALLAELGRSAADAGDVARAVELARRRAKLDPLSEDAARGLMQQPAAAGDRAGALAAYERLRDRLARELGVAPAEATRQLAADLRAQPAAIVAGLPPRLAERAFATGSRRRVAAPFARCWWRASRGLARRASPPRSRAAPAPRCCTGAATRSRSRRTSRGSRRSRRLSRVRAARTSRRSPGTSCGASCRRWAGARAHRRRRMPRGSASGSMRASAVY